MEELTHEVKVALLSPEGQSLLVRVIADALNKSTPPPVRETFVQKACREAIEDIARDTVRKWISGHKSTLRNAIVKQISAGKNSIAEQIVSGVIADSNCSWKFNVNIEADE
jgi:hypothetical protein